MVKNKSPTMTWHLASLEVHFTPFHVIPITFKSDFRLCVWGAGFFFRESFFAGSTLGPALQLRVRMVSEVCDQ